MCEVKVKKLFKEILEIEKGICSDRAHRIKINTHKNNGNKRPKTVILTLKNYKDKDLVLRNVHEV